eukprot:6038667-Alexandrium_andersonii.AAC.1
MCPPPTGPLSPSPPRPRPRRAGPRSPSTRPSSPRRTGTCSRRPSLLASPGPVVGRGGDGAAVGDGWSAVLGAVCSAAVRVGWSAPPFPR